MLPAVVFIYAFYLIRQNVSFLGQRLCWFIMQSWAMTHQFQGVGTQCMYIAQVDGWMMDKWLIDNW